MPPDRLPVQGVGSQEGSCPTATKPLHEPTLPLHTTISSSGTKPLWGQVLHKALLSPLHLPSPSVLVPRLSPHHREGEGTAMAVGSEVEIFDLFLVSKDFSDLFCPSSVSLLTTPQEADPEMRSPAPVPLTLPSLETSAF